MSNWIICPVRNAVKYTKAALPTFLAQDVGDVNVLIINNASDDGTTQWLNSLADKRVFVSHQDPPLSVAASWNFGLRWLFEPQPIPMKNAWRPPLAEYALVVNNDVLLRPDTYGWLKSCADSFVTAVGNNDPQCIEPSVRVNQEENFGVLSFEPPEGTIRPHPDFSCFMIHRDCWQKVGPFDERFAGGYVEDADYHIRMHNADIEAYCIDLPFYHVASGTAKEAGDKEREAIGKRADANRKLFREIYGCNVGSEEYYALFKQTEVNG